MSIATIIMGMYLMPFSFQVTNKVNKYLEVKVFSFQYLKTKIKRILEKQKSILLEIKKNTNSRFRGKLYCFFCKCDYMIIRICKIANSVTPISVDDWAY